MTGAGRPVSLGRSHALAFAAAGARVVVNDNGPALGGDGADVHLAEAVAAEIRDAGGETVANSDSVATPDGARAVVRTALDAFGRLDVLVNNVGNQRMGLVHESADADVEALAAVHLLGIYGNTVYGAVKEGIVGFNRGIARDLGPHGVGCNAIRPGAVSRMRADPLVGALAHEAEEVHAHPGDDQRGVCASSTSTMVPVANADAGEVRKSRVLSSCAGSPSRWRGQAQVSSSTPAPTPSIISVANARGAIPSR